MKLGVGTVLVVGLLLSGELRGHARSHRVTGPDFEAWDFRYGRIEGADAEWTMKALANGSLDNRELSCEVVKRQTTLRFPLSGQFPRYGFTFEYKTRKPGLPVDLYVVYPDRYAPDVIGPITQRGTQTYKLRARSGRFCYSESDVSGSVQFPGRYCYSLTIQGIHLKDWCVDLLNGHAAVSGPGPSNTALERPMAEPAPDLPGTVAGGVAMEP